ncbi:MAG: hypothetical protein QM655_02180 [Nocardioidaceae bacterium]
MPYRLDPQVAGELGPDTDLDTSTHPPKVKRLEYVLDQPETDELITSFPVFLVSDQLGSRLKKAHLDGFKLTKAPVRPSDNYRQLYGKAEHRDYRWLQVTGAPGRSDFWLDQSFNLCVSDGAMAILESAVLSGCTVVRLAD